MSIEGFLGSEVTENKERDFLLDEIISLIERMDFLDIQILRKFYMTNKEFPNDTQPWCFPILYMEMKVNHRMTIGMEALRKRLDELVKVGFLEKIGNSNPTNYIPVAEKVQLVKALITKFFLINGLTSSL